MFPSVTTAGNLDHFLSVKGRGIYMGNNVVSRFKVVSFVFCRFSVIDNIAGYNWNTEEHCFYERRVCSTRTVAVHIDSGI